MLADGSYRELESSGLDFTKSLVSSAGTGTDVVESGDTNAIPCDSDPLLVASAGGDSVRNGSAPDESDGTGTVPLVEAETRSTGNVSKSVYFSYIFAGGNVGKVWFLTFVCVLLQILSTGEEYWLGYWCVFRTRDERASL